MENMKHCPVCGNLKLIRSFRNRKGETLSVCNVCRLTQYTMVHSGITNNKTYLRYGIKINGYHPISSRYQKGRGGE